MVTTIKLAICQVTKMMSNRHHIHLPTIPPECCSGRPSTFWFLEPEALQAIQPMQVEDMSAVFFCHFNDISVHELGDPQIMQRNKKKMRKKRICFYNFYASGFDFSCTSDNMEILSEWQHLSFRRIRIPPLYKLNEMTNEPNKRLS